ncbi:MFS transporter [Streptomyces sp. NPDC051018]|uniref:MFS transporter n=1 Tax=Streptomyces sp. NPDC051018 TaxID=3365639 RepID=UPI0037B92AEE
MSYLRNVIAMRERYGWWSYAVGAAAARTGDEMSGPALMLTALAVTGSAVAASSLLAGITVAAAAGGPLFGVLLDRAPNPGRLLAAALAGYGTALLVILFALGRLPVAFTVVLAVLAGLLGPALAGGWTSQLPRVVPSPGLPRANALDAMTYSAAGLLGPAAAGAAAHLAGAAAGVVMSAALIGLALPSALALPGRGGGGETGAARGTGWDSLRGTGPGASSRTRRGAVPEFEGDPPVSGARPAGAAPASGAPDRAGPPSVSGAGATVTRGGAAPAPGRGVGLLGGGTGLPVAGGASPAWGTGLPGTPGPEQAALSEVSGSAPSDVSGSASSEVSGAVPLPAPSPSLRAELAAGFRAIAGIRPLARATAASTVSCAGQGMFVACAPLLGERALGGAGQGTVLLSGVAVTALAANAVLARRPRLLSPDTVVGWSTVVLAVALALTATAHPVLLAVAVVLIGMGEGPQLTALFAIRHREAPERLRARIFTTGASLKITGFAVGAAAAGPLAVRSLPGALLSAAALQLPAALCCVPRPTAQRPRGAR